jgi:hypothetical protein
VTRPAVTRTAWTLCGLAVVLATASVVLAAFNGFTPWDLVVAHLGIGTLSAASFPVLGALIVARQPRNWFGWLLLVYGVLLGTFVFTQQYAFLTFGISGRRWPLPGGALASWLGAWTNLPGIILGSTLLVLLFPDGRAPSPRWRPVVWASLLLVVASAGVQAALNWPLQGPELARVGMVGTTEATGVVFQIGFTAALVLLVVCVIAQVFRFRRAAGIQRQQLKWFAYGGILSVPLGVPAMVPTIGAVLELLQVPILFSAITIAMFRYRLYDIDRLYNRTLVYGLLTAILGGLYAVGVLGVGQAVSVNREPSSLVVAATTLAVAAAFQPLRRRIQTLVDRRFNRRRYDAARTIEAFSGRLRQQVDLDALSRELLAVVDQTMQPSRAVLWIRPVDPPPPKGTVTR